MADRVLLLAKREQGVWLEAALKFWRSGNLCRLGSPAQQLYITYLVYELMRDCELTEEMFDYIRTGMQERIQVRSEDLQQQGLLIWKQYVTKMGFDIHVDEEDNQLPDVTAEKVFLKSKEAPKIVPIVEQPEAKPEPIYAEDDSDNDSDFEPIYKINQDNHVDLKNLQKPLFLTDLIQALMSDDFERFTLGLSSAEGLIRSQNLNDLEIMTPDLLAVLFRAENKFDLPDFLPQKYGLIQAVCELSATGPKEVFMRLQDTEASLGDKILLFETIGLAAQGIANQSF